MNKSRTKHCINCVSIFSPRLKWDLQITPKWRWHSRGQGFDPPRFRHRTLPSFASDQRRAVRSRAARVGSRAEAAARCSQHWAPTLEPHVSAPRQPPRRAACVDDLPRHVAPAGHDARRAKRHILGQTEDDARTPQEDAHDPKHAGQG